MAEHTRLGRGLAALIGDVDEEISVAEADAQDRPRADRRSHATRATHRTFPDDELDELAESINERGVVQPIVVREDGEPGTYEIVAGERRWRAAQRAGLHDVPIAIVDATDVQSLNSPSSRTCSAPTSTHRGGGRLRRADGAVQSHRRSRWRKSSARAGRTSPTWCGC